MLDRINAVLRRADVVTHRATVHAFNAWATFNRRCALAFTRFVCSLPRAAADQEAALYASCIAGVVTILIVDWAGRA